MNAFEVFKDYMALKRHFSNSSYDYFKYGGKVRGTTPDSFIKRKDKIYFEKLAKKFNKKTDIVNFFVANFSKNEKLWIKDLAYSENSENVYKDWLKKRQSLSYYFATDLKNLNIKNESSFNELFLIKSSEHPVLLKKYLGNEINFETFCILLKISKAMKYWNRNSSLSSDFIWEELRVKVEKYTPFIEFDEEKLVKIIVDIIND